MRIGFQPNDPLIALGLCRRIAVAIVYVAGPPTDEDGPGRVGATPMSGDWRWPGWENAGMQTWPAERRRASVCLRTSCNPPGNGIGGGTAPAATLVVTVCPVLAPALVSPAPAVAIFAVCATVVAMSAVAVAMSAVASLVCVVLIITSFALEAFLVICACVCVCVVLAKVTDGVRAINAF